MHHLLEGMMHNSLSYNASTTVIQLQSILIYTRSITTLNFSLKWLRRLSSKKQPPPPPPPPPPHLSLHLGFCHHHCLQCLLQHISFLFQRVVMHLSIW